MKAIVNRLAKSESRANFIFSLVLRGLKMRLDQAARKHSFFRERLKERNLTVQIRLQDNSCGRHYTLREGAITSEAGIHDRPDVDIFFANARVALDLLLPPRDQLATINAMKAFQLGMVGPDSLSTWWMETLSLMESAGTRFGIDLGGGVTRYTSNTNGGPVFVYVKDGRILRITPIDFGNDDALPWTINARGRSFTPPRKTTVMPFTLMFKSLVYSPDRLLYPMKRVDFDPDGERNPQNRGVSSSTSQSGSKGRQNSPISSCRPVPISSAST